MILGEMFAGDDMTDKQQKASDACFLLSLAFGCGRIGARYDFWLYLEKIIKIYCA